MYVPERPCAPWQGHADGMRGHRGGKPSMSPLMVRVQFVRSVPAQSIVETEPGCRARELNRFYPEVLIPSAPDRTTPHLSRQNWHTASQPGYKVLRSHLFQGLAENWQVARIFAHAEDARGPRLRFLRSLRDETLSASGGRAADSRRIDLPNGLFRQGGAGLLRRPRTDRPHRSVSDGHRPASLRTVAPRSSPWQWTLSTWRVTNPPSKPSG